MFKLGSQGSEVRDIQLLLAKMGFKLKGTGYFGGATDVAVRAFQRAQGLADDGVVAEVTLTALSVAASHAGAIVVHPEVTARPLWLIEALRWVGTHEGVGVVDNPTIIEWAQEEGGNIAKDYKHDSTAWCALFANMVLTKVGLVGTETLWALDFNSDAMKKRVGHGWPAMSILGPSIGAFAPMSRTGGGHITIIVGKDRAGNLVGVGGNQSDAVNVRSFPRERFNQGFWWPLDVSPPANLGVSSLPIVNADGSTRES